MLDNHLLALEDAAQNNSEFPSCPDILDDEELLKEKKKRTKFTSQVKFCEQMKRVKNGHMPSLYCAAVLLPNVTAEQRAELETFTHSIETKQDEIETNVVKSEAMPTFVSPWTGAGSAQAP